MHYTPFVPKNVTPSVRNNANLGGEVKYSIPKSANLGGDVILPRTTNLDNLLSRFVVLSGITSNLGF